MLNAIINPAQENPRIACDKNPTSPKYSGYKKR